MARARGYSAIHVGVLVTAISMLVTGCEREPQVVAGPGVDLENRVLYVGALNAESGPAAELGRPFALGLRTLVHRINRGDADLMPEGWRVRLVERDQAYDPERVISTFEETHDQVLFYVSVFGSSSAVLLQSRLEEHGIVGFPTSNLSALGEHPNTPPVGPSYYLEGMRAMDWAVDQADGTEDLRVGVIYRGDEYGNDGYNGWLTAAQYYDIDVAVEHMIPADGSDHDLAGTLEQLRAQEVDVVFLATFPRETAAIMTGAAAIEYSPSMWIGNTPFIHEGFFDSRTIDPALFRDAYLVTGFPVWGDDRPVVRDFRESLEAYTEGRIAPNTYILTSYVWAQPGFEAFRRALEQGDVSREGYMRALRSIDDFETAGAFPDPLDFTRLPYRTATRTRILHMDMDAGELVMADDYANPRSMNEMGDR